MEYMSRALHLSERARLLSPPNPWVGCVLVRDGEIVGEGFTQAPGGNHAEAQALKQAGERANGATAYVTLEPCSHYGRTPPCTNALIAAKVKHVVAALEDPDSKVAGSGLKQLGEAGITTELGLLCDEVRASLRPYLHHRQKGRAFCLAKAAISIDGRMAAADRTSQWITCSEAQEDVHRLRAESQAIMIGVGTALSDRPSLTIRHYHGEGLKQPLRVVLDRTGRLPANGPLFDTSLASTLIITSSSCSGTTRKAWESKGVEVVVLESLDEVFTYLGKRGVLQVLVEGGPTLLGVLAQQQLIDQLSIYVGPCILGDKGLPLFGGMDIATIAEAPKLSLEGSAVFGDTVRMDYFVKGLKKETIA